jgi:hypothetical protein
MDITTDADGRAATISSLNPNLRVQGFQANLGPTGGSVTFVVGPGSPHVTVVELGGRFFLRDGHHRAAALMAAGITAAPVVVVTGTSYADAAMVPGLFGPGVALGDRPPMVADFLDEGVSAAAVRRPLRKITRFSPSEFPMARLSRSSALAALSIRAFGGLTAALTAPEAVSLYSSELPKRTFRCSARARIGHNSPWRGCWVCRMGFAAQHLLRPVAWFVSG